MRQRIKFLSFLLTFVFLLQGCRQSQDDGPAGLTEMNFITSDIDLFWEFFDNADLNDLTALKVRDNYINLGTSGLQDFSFQKDLSGALSNILPLSPYQDYYSSVRQNTLDLSEVIEKSNVGVDNLSAIFPEISYTNVFFIIGGLNAGGRISQNGLLIAAEMFSKSPTTSTSELNDWVQNVTRSQAFMPSIVIHELIHFQQAFIRSNTGVTSVLEQSILEGMADYISNYLLNDQPFANSHLHEYGDPIELEIWTQFDSEKGLQATDGEWLYTGSRTRLGHPADMGYYVGYQIVEAYASKFPTQTEAIRAMLLSEDYNQLFRDSEYNGQ